MITIHQREITKATRHALRRAAKRSASMHAKRSGRLVDPDGYASAALYGVADAVRTFDPTKGAAFQTWAYLRVSSQLSNEDEAQLHRASYARVRPLPMPTRSLDGVATWLRSTLPTPEEALMAKELDEEWEARLARCSPRVQQALRYVAQGAGITDALNMAGLRGQGGLGYVRKTMQR